jgi:2-polyprenyl-3-methyl-5-hydroxy-6-metoxy-1,4-benzoquinol methylase
MNTENKPKYKLDAESRIAYESLDHLHPWGTARDNSTNKRFNEKIYKIYANNKEPLRVLDMGCSGGGFVKSCHDEGCEAVGLEGSDYSLRMKRAEWKTIPENLFTCDITKHFQVSKLNGENYSNMKFNVITCWEVMEHLEIAGIEGLCKNVINHLSDNGIWVMSICYVDDIINGVNLHRTVQQKKWWIEKFEALGLFNMQELDNYFNQQYIRGNRYAAPNSFHLVLTKDKNKAPKVPDYKFTEKMYDAWRGSYPHRILARAIEIK